MNYLILQILPSHHYLFSHLALVILIRLRLLKRWNESSPFPMQELTLQAFQHFLCDRQL